MSTSFFSFESLFRLSPRTRWMIIVVAFSMIAILDFSTPSEYVLASLYTVPMLVSVSFLRPGIAKTLLVLAVLGTLLNLVLPVPVLHIPSVLVNRSLAALAILISAFFMLRYIQYQERLQAQEKELSSERYLARVREDLIATLTHDLKTPLLGEQATLNYLQDGTFGPLTPEQQEVVGALNRSNRRQLDLVETLLSVYRNDNLGVDVQLSAINLDEHIADLLTELQYLAVERHITLDYECRETPPPVRGDALQIKRVLSNLIHNALNYTPSSGHIRVTLISEKSQVQVAVTDTGPGLSPGELENVFHRFYRGAGEREVIGTGLGLYLSRQIIEAHQGRIWAENVAPHGCRFLLTLPVARETVMPEEVGR